MRNSLLSVLAVLYTCLSYGQAQSYWSPSPGNSWNWNIGNSICRANFQKTAGIWDIDPDNEPTDVAFLSSQGINVICYVNVASLEVDSRKDASKFPQNVIGSDYPGWPGEKFLDIRSATVRTLMLARFQAAKTAGCQSIEPDNLDSYTNDTGFGLTAADAYDYIKWLSTTIRGLGMSVALKNCDDLLQTYPDLADLTDYVIVENCVALNNCNNYKAFKSKGKALLGCDYVSTGSSGGCDPALPDTSAATLKSTCDTYAAAGFSGIIRDCGLSCGGGDSYSYTCPGNTSGDKSNSTATTKPTSTTSTKAKTTTSTKSAKVKTTTSTTLTKVKTTTSTTLTKVKTTTSVPTSNTDPTDDGNSDPTTTTDPNPTNDSNNDPNGDSTGDDNTSTKTKRRNSKTKEKQHSRTNGRQNQNATNGSDNNQSYSASTDSKANSTIRPFSNCTNLDNSQCPTGQICSPENHCTINCDSGNGQPNNTLCGKRGTCHSSSVYGKLVFYCSFSKVPNDTVINYSPDTAKPCANLDFNQCPKTQVCGTQNICTPNCNDGKGNKDNSKCGLNGVCSTTPHPNGKTVYYCDYSQDTTYSPDTAKPCANLDFNQCPKTQVCGIQNICTPNCNDGKGNKDDSKCGLNGVCQTAKAKNGKTVYYCDYESGSSSTDDSSYNTDQNDYGTTDNAYTTKKTKTTDKTYDSTTGNTGTYNTQNAAYDPNAQATTFYATRGSSSAYSNSGSSSSPLQYGVITLAVILAMYVLQH